MESYVDLFRPRVILVVFGEFDGGFIVRKEDGGVESNAEELKDGGASPGEVLRLRYDTWKSGRNDDVRSQMLNRGPDFSMMRKQE